VYRARRRKKRDVAVMRRRKGTGITMPIAALAPVESPELATVLVL